MHKILWRLRTRRTRSELTHSTDLDAIVKDCQIRLKAMKASGFTVQDSSGNVVRQWRVKPKGGHRKGD